MQQRALALVVLGALALSLAAWWRWPPSEPALDCPPERVTLGPDGVARCGAGAALPAGQALTVGQPLDLNAVTEADLALLPGVGPELARAIVEARHQSGGFTTWEQVDAVPGVGPARLETLQRACALTPH